MGTTPAPGVDPDYDELVQDETGTTPHSQAPPPIDVRVIEAVRTETLPPRTLLSDQTAVGVLAARIVGEQRSRQCVVLSPVLDIFIGGTGVTIGTGFLVKAGTVLTLSVTDAIYGIAAVATTCHVLTTLHEG